VFFGYAKTNKVALEAAERFDLRGRDSNGGRYSPFGNSGNECRDS
jgi:hypothetical protein